MFYGERPVKKAMSKLINTHEGDQKDWEIKNV